jgi:hypothetical protein
MAFQNPGLFNSSMVEAIRQRRQIFGGTNTDSTFSVRGQEYTMSGNQADMAMIANDMGVSPEVVQDIWKNRQQIGAESDIGQRLFALRDEKSRLLKQSGGNRFDPDYQTAMTELHEGTGQYADGRLPSMTETLEKLQQYDDKGHIKVSDEQWQAIEDAESSKDKYQAIDKVLAESSRERETPPVEVKFTGLAGKLLKQVLSESSPEEAAKIMAGRSDSTANSKSVLPADYDSSGFLESSMDTVGDFLGI